MVKLKWRVGKGTSRGSTVLGRRLRVDGLGHPSVVVVFDAKGGAEWVMDRGIVVVEEAVVDGV